MRWWNKISRLGARKGMPAADERSLIVVNRISAIMAVFVASSIVINLILGTLLFVPVLSAALLLLCLIYVLNDKGRFFAAKFTLMGLALSLLFYMCITAGLGSGLEFYFISLTALPVLIFRNTRTIILFQVLCILFLVGQKAYVDIVRPEDPSRALAYQVFYIVNSIYSCLLIIVAIFFFRNLIRKREKELEESYHTISSKNLQLENANKELDTFTYSVSHDLRAPLRAIDGFASLLERNGTIGADAEAKEFLGVIQQNAAQMRELIEDLLKLARLSKIEINVEPVDMDAMVQEVLEEFEEEIKRNNARVDINALPKAKADETLIKQVWHNLISNAVKYSAKTASPEVEVGADRKRRQTIYYVKDNGIGFDMGSAAGLFQPFRRLHAGNEYTGTGVGLAIVANIVRAHGGKVWAESERGKGSTFYFTLDPAEGKE